MKMSTGALLRGINEEDKTVPLAVEKYPHDRAIGQRHCSPKWNKAVGCSISAPAQAVG